MRYATLLLGAMGIAAQAQTPFRTSFSLRELRAQMEAKEAAQAMSPDLVSTKAYQAYSLSVPTDHFHNETRYEPHSNETFELHYWFDATHYKPGGPIIVLQGGETDGADRLPFLEKGIVAQLSQATNGLGVILEHRYYGLSFPMPDLSVESLRFLTTEQSVADMAYFAQHIVFPGLEHLDLTAPKNPYIAYGGSYAGGFVAFLRKVYPDIYWGAIASSAVVEAIEDYWAYTEAVRLFVLPECVAIQSKVIDVIDKIIIGRKDSEYVQKIKDVFGLSNLTRSDDFGDAVTVHVGGLLQGTNWDPAHNSTSLGTYCRNLVADTLQYQNAHLEDDVQGLLDLTGYGDELDTLTTGMLNYIGYVNQHVVSRCGGGQTQDQCFSNFNQTFYKKDDIKQTWRAWPWQYCTEWGYLVTGSGVPADQLSLTSRIVDLEYEGTVCREAFNITGPPDLERVNKYGGFNISYPRLAFIDGSSDPWRAATPHAIGLEDRLDTISEPFIMIDKGVHHWDENGLFPNETRPGIPPKAVIDAQAREAEFVKAWLAEWKDAQFMGDL